MCFIHSYIIVKERTSTNWTSKEDYAIEDIKILFDNIDHELQMRAVRKYTNELWILILIDGSRRHLSFRKKRKLNETVVHSKVV